MNRALKQQIADELDVPADSLTDGTILRDLEYWDSVTALTVMVLIEQETGTPVDPDKFSEIVTFGDLAALAARKVD